jgi:hypothetical protein
VAKGNPRRARGVAASDSLPLFPPDVSDKPCAGEMSERQRPTSSPMPRKTNPTPGGPRAEGDGPPAYGCPGEKGQAQLDGLSTQNPPEDSKG